MGEKGTVPFKSLAPWKTWWGSTPVAHDLACSVKECIDPTKIPGGGVFLSFNVSGKVTVPDLQDGHSARVLEGILRSYPAEKDPSAYLLGDSLLHLNDMLGGCIFGPHAPNPINEKCRREKILKEGTKMKQLLSYVRASSGRTDKGRSATVTFLKELALSRGRPKRSKSASPSTCSTLSATTMVLGEEPTSSSSRSSGASVQSIQDIQNDPKFADMDPVGKTLMLLGLNPNDGCSQDLFDRFEAMQEPAIIPSPEPIGGVVDGLPETLVAPEEPVSDVAPIDNTAVTVGDDEMAIASQKESDMDTSMPDGSVPTPGESAAGGMPDVPLRRIRSKTPALAHPTVSKKLRSRSRTLGNEQHRQLRNQLHHLRHQRSSRLPSLRISFRSQKECHWNAIRALAKGAG